MAFGQAGSDDPPAFRIGVDIMKVEPPKRDPFPKFVNMFKAQVSLVLYRGS
jgi:4'-phosphopantetheinyl transferase